MAKTWHALEVVDWLRAYNYAQLKLDDNAEELTQMKAMKLLYYGQGIALAGYGFELFSEDLLAFKYGPVVKKVHETFRGLRNIVEIECNGQITDAESGIDEVASKHFDLLSSDYETKTVMENFGSMSAIDLMKQTHEEAPWLKTKLNCVIKKPLLKDYFTKEILE